MAEELRIFLRTGLYGLGVGVVYWIVTYDIIGTILFAFLGLGGAIFFVGMARMVPATRQETSPPRAGSAAGHVVSLFHRVLGLEEHDGAAHASPLRTDEDPLPESSVWPVVGASAFLLVGLGLIYGGWFIVPGIAIGAAAAWGWLTQLHGF